MQETPFGPVYDNVLEGIGKFIATAFVAYIKLGIDVFQWLLDKGIEVYNFIKDLPGNISSAASGMFDGIKNAFRSAINWIVDAWNGLEFTLPSIDTHIPGIGTVGGFSLGTPNLPRLAKGGITSGPTLAVIGDNPGGREAVIPLPPGGALGGGGGNTFNIYALDGRAAAEAVVSAMRDAKRYGLTGVSI